MVQLLVNKDFSDQSYCTSTHRRSGQSGPISRQVNLIHHANRFMEHINLRAEVRRTLGKRRKERKNNWLNQIFLTVARFRSHKKSLVYHTEIKVFSNWSLFMLVLQFLMLPSKSFLLPKHLHNAYIHIAPLRNQAKKIYFWTTMVE